MKFVISLFLCAAVTCEAQTAPLPQIRQSGAVKQFFVDDKPFIMLSGELHNSSPSSIEYMRPIWDKLATLHLNTVIGAASWELVEPKEGKFDFSLVDDQINQARQRNMRLVLIWFATWKNAGSSYPPDWVKGDPKRFPPMVLKVRPVDRLRQVVDELDDDFRQIIGGRGLAGEEEGARARCRGPGCRAGADKERRS